MDHDPHAVPCGQCHAPNLHETHATTSYPPPSHMPSSPSLPLAPFQRHHVAFAPGTSYSASDLKDLNIPPPPSLSNIRYGRISQRVPHRSKTLKRVRCVYYSTRLRIRLADPLRSHALVQTSSTPTLCPTRQSQQNCLTSTTIMINVVTHNRYSAATGDPNDFKDDGLTLR